MGRTVKVFGGASYLGRDQELTMEVTFCNRLLVAARFIAENGVDRIVVKAEITGQEGRYNLNTECLGHLGRQYESENGEPPTKLLVMTWEKALNEVWARVLA